MQTLAIEENQRLQRLERKRHKQKVIAYLHALSSQKKESDMSQRKQEVCVFTGLYILCTCIPYICSMLVVISLIIVLYCIYYTTPYTLCLLILLYYTTIHLTTYLTRSA